MNIQNLLNKWNIKCDYNTLLSMWNESHRYYHNLDHLNDLFEKIEFDKYKFSEKEYEILMLSALFHDCIYNPSKSNNEEMSADFFINCCKSVNNDIQIIKNIILETKTHNSSTKLSKIFCDYDMSIVNENYDKLLKWENGIYNEYKIFGNEMYKIGRLKFLESLLDKSEYINNTENLVKLIEYVKDTY